MPYFIYCAFFVYHTFCHGYLLVYVVLACVLTGSRCLNILFLLFSCSRLSQTLLFLYDLNWFPIAWWNPFQVLQPQLSNLVPVFLYHGPHTALFRLCWFLLSNQSYNSSTSALARCKPIDKMGRETTNGSRNLIVLFILIFTWTL